MKFSNTPIFTALYHLFRGSATESPGNDMAPMRNVFGIYSLIVLNYISYENKSLGDDIDECNRYHDRGRKGAQRAAV